MGARLKKIEKKKHSRDFALLIWLPCLRYSTDFEHLFIKLRFYAFCIKMGTDTDTVGLSKNICTKIRLGRGLNITWINI